MKHAGISGLNHRCDKRLRDHWSGGCTVAQGTAGDDKYPVPDLKRFQFAPVEIGLASGWAGRLSFTGEDGYELYIPSEMAMAAHEALVAAGLATQGYTPVAACVSKRLPAFGHELTPGTTPFEAGLGAFTAFGSGFVGEDALKDHQPTRRIVSFLFDTPDAIPIHDEPIYFDGRVVGQITSAAWSYKFSRSVALGMVTAPLIGFSPKPSLKALK